MRHFGFEIRALRRQLANGDSRPADGTFPCDVALTSLARRRVGSQPQRSNATTSFVWGVRALSEAALHLSCRLPNARSASGERKRHSARRCNSSLAATRVVARTKTPRSRGFSITQITDVRSLRELTNVDNGSNKTHHTNTFTGASSLTCALFSFVRTSTLRSSSSRASPAWLTEL